MKANQQAAMAYFPHVTLIVSGTHSHHLLLTVEETYMYACWPCLMGEGVANFMHASHVFSSILIMKNVNKNSIIITIIIVLHVCSLFINDYVIKYVV